MLRFASSTLYALILFLSSIEQSFAVTYDNCETSTQIDYVPQRILAIDINAAEIALALGLAPQMIATAAVADPELVLADYRAGFLSLSQLSPTYPSAKKILASGTDFVIAGWNSGFFNGSLITPEALATEGVGSYVLRETCKPSDLGPQASQLFGATLADIETLARIAGKEEEGARLLDALRKRLARVEAEVAAYGRAEPPSVFVYDSGTLEPFTAGGPSALNDAISAAGARNIAKELPNNWGTISWKALIEAAPEVIVLVDYGFGDGERKRRSLLARPDLKSIPAIRDKNFFLVPYAAALSGVRSVGLAELLSDHLICSFSPRLNQGDFSCLNQPYSPLD